MVLVGAPGLGKTHLSVAVGLALLKRGYTARFTLREEGHAHHVEQEPHAVGARPARQTRWTRIGSRPGSVEVLAQVDRAPGYDHSNGDWQTTRRYYVTRGADARRITSRLLADLGRPTPARSRISSRAPGASQVAVVVRFFLARGWGVGSGGARGADQYAFQWVAETPGPDDGEPTPTALHRIFVVPDGEPVHALMEHIASLSPGERLWFEQGVLAGDTVLVPHEALSDTPAFLALPRLRRRFRCTAREAVVAHYEAEARRLGVGVRSIFGRLGSADAHKSERHEDWTLNATEARAMTPWVGRASEARAQLGGVERTILVLLP